MNSHIRHATSADAGAISELIGAGFAEHVAPGWEPQARRHFFEENQPEKLGARIGDACLCLVCEHEARIVGVIFLPRPSLVQLFFVAPDRLREGIGRRLWRSARAELEKHHPETKTVELNASPYAVAAYRALGFFPISKPFRRQGAVATRMACWLPGETLDSAANGS